MGPVTGGGTARLPQPWVEEARAGLPQEQVSVEGAGLGQRVGSGQSLGSRGEVHAALGSGTSRMLVDKGGLLKAQCSPGKLVKGSKTQPSDRPGKWGSQRGGPTLLPREGAGSQRALGQASPRPLPDLHPKPRAHCPYAFKGLPHSYPSQGVSDPAYSLGFGGGAAGE